jgi:hypothetical protein
MEEIKDPMNQLSEDIRTIWKRLKAEKNPKYKNLYIEVNKDQNLVKLFYRIQQNNHQTKHVSTIPGMKLAEWNSLVPEVIEELLDKWAH